MAVRRQSSENDVAAGYRVFCARSVAAVVVAGTWKAMLHDADPSIGTPIAPLQASLGW